MTVKQLKVLNSVILQGVATSTATITQVDLDKPTTLGVYSSLSRAGVVHPQGRDNDGNFKWELSEDIDKKELKDLIDRLLS